MAAEDSVKIYIKIFKNGKMPVYASSNSAGCDVYAAEDMVLWPGETKLMPLDFIIASPPDIEVQIRPRSGLSLKTSLRVPNSPGTVDSDFRDPVCVILQNTYSFTDFQYKAARNPELLKTLADDYREISLADFIKMRNITEGNTSSKNHSGNVNLTGGSDRIKQAAASNSAIAGLSVLETIIYIDANGNPYGTICIKKGERIAQMVFGKFERAEFIIHPDPASVGNNRGGGFGHTDSI